MLKMKISLLLKRQDQSLSSMRQTHTVTASNSDKSRAKSRHTDSLTYSLCVLEFALSVSQKQRFKIPWGYNLNALITPYHQEIRVACHKIIRLC